MFVVCFGFMNVGVFSVVFMRVGVELFFESGSMCVFFLLVFLMLL